MKHRDILLRSIAVLSWIFAFWFSIDARLKPEALAIIWGCASLIYWWIVHEFESRDRKWEKEDKSE
jgi:hypothetical protein